MAEQIFPLSPIAARAALPSDEDYDAIREAFMETSRGRWFLTEYAKRNRNADTALVLDAVARLEASAAAPKPEQQTPPPEDRSAALAASVSALVATAREEAAALLPAQPEFEDDSPALKGVRVLREMSWAMRESGSDGRVPDLLQKQATAIEDGLKATASQDVRARVLALLDRLSGDIDRLAHRADTAEAPIAREEEDLDETLAMLSDEFAQFQPDDSVMDQIASLVAEPEPEPVDVREPAVAPPDQPPPAAAPTLSLGAALLETGIVAKPLAPRGDPLAPFRRMTQAERIAFFS